MLNNPFVSECAKVFFIVKYQLVMKNIQVSKDGSE